MKHQKVATILWTIDPEDKKRFLLRHNKPFNGYEDEWTITFGDIEEGESIEQAARRESSEEYGIHDFEEIVNLQYKIDFEGKQGQTEAHFVTLKIESLDVPVTLNEESIGYDWVLLDKAKELMQHEDEKKAFDLVK